MRIELNSEHIFYKHIFNVLNALFPYYRGRFELVVNNGFEYFV